jgi:hypothetical protein
MSETKQEQGTRWAQFERFEIQMTLEEAEGASHPGPCDDDVSALLTMPHISAQLDTIGAHSIREELAEYGAWDDAELADDEENRARIVWIAAGNITEEEASEERGES